MAKLVIVVILAALIMQLNGISAQKLKVGDDQGWTLSTSGFYDTWAAKQDFVVGVTLVFEFTSAHNVATVKSKEAYDNCDATLDTNSVTVTDSPYETTLTEAGQYYYFCTIGSHCAGGQKFAAIVSAAASDNSSTTPSAMLPPPPPPSPPQPPSPPPSAAALGTSSIFATLTGLVLALLY